MLVLTRKNNEQLILNESIKITILKISGSKVRIGIEAPDDVSIRRGELAPRESSTQEIEVDLGNETDTDSAMILQCKLSDLTNGMGPKQDRQQENNRLNPSNTPPKRREPGLRSAVQRATRQTGPGNRIADLHTAP